MSHSIGTKPAVRNPTCMLAPQPNVLADSSNRPMGGLVDCQHGFDDLGVGRRIPKEVKNHGVVVRTLWTLLWSFDAGAVHPADKGLGSFHEAAHQAAQELGDLGGGRLLDDFRWMQG